MTLKILMLIQHPMLGSPWTTNLAMILIMITIAVIIEHQVMYRAIQIDIGTQIHGTLVMTM